MLTHRASFRDGETASQRQRVDVCEFLDCKKSDKPSWIGRGRHLSIVERFGLTFLRVFDSSLAFSEGIQVANCLSAQIAARVDACDGILLPGGQALRPSMNLLKDCHQLLPFISVSPEGFKFYVPA
jgi:cyanophycinase-like exopeptidase